MLVLSDVNTPVLLTLSMKLSSKSGECKHFLKGSLFLQNCLNYHYHASLNRKVQTESATGSVSVSKVRTTLTIKIEAIDFDTQGCVLRLKGRNIQENQYVKVLVFIIHNILPEIIHFFSS